MSDIKVRVGQSNAIKVVSSISGSAGGNAVNAENVIGGIASVRSLTVSGISTFSGIATFKSDVYIDGDLYIGDDLNFDEFNARNGNISGILTTTNLRVGYATVTNALYYDPTYTSGIAYFNSANLMVSTGATTSAIDYTNVILTTDNSGIPIWSNTIDGGVY